VRRVFSIMLVLAVLLFIAGCGGNRRTEARHSVFTPADTSLPKAASIIPPEQRLVAREPSIVMSGGGYMLSWKYENPGDYAQEGKVGVEDITPIAQHFNETASPVNEWIDGSGEGVIGVADITPIAMNWASEVTGYRIDGADASAGPWNEVASLTLDGGDASGGRLAFAWEFAPGHIYYRIVTLTPSGDAAFSDTLIAPSNEPIIYGVTPTSGYQHEEYTFSATASGQAPLTYAWDFGGGASPNTSSDISPTVTLADAGEYSATLTISNAYGPTTFPFTLTVTARDMWVHTWGGASYEDTRDVAVDGDGNIYVLGQTESFGAGKQDSLVLKYSPAGSLLWAKTWGGIKNEYPRSIQLLPDENIAVGGYMQSYGAGMDDIYILKYDSNGVLLSQKTWGTTGYERAEDMAVDAEGALYFVGSYFPTGGKPDFMAIKLSSEGIAEWAKTWGGGGLDVAKCVAIDIQGNVLVAGNPDSDALSYDAVLLDITTSGNLQWAKSWGGDGINIVDSIATDASNRIYLAGSTDSFGAGDKDIFLQEWSPTGEIVRTTLWGTGATEGQAFLVCGESGRLCLACYTEAYDFPRQGVLLEYGTLGELLICITVKAESSFRGITEDEHGNIFMVGHSANNSWTWENATEVVSNPNIQTNEYTAIMKDIAGITNDVEGITESPFGVEDIGGGLTDALVIENFPR
jgi:uncharacterized delta-60 repeat protein